MPSSSRKPMFYGWKLSILMLFGNFMFQGGAIYLMNVFIQPFGELYGWNRGQLGSAQGLGSFVGMAAAPLLASFAMRLGLRRTMLAGALCGGFSLFMLARIPDFWLFTLNFCLLWASSQACGGVLGNALMSNWFVRHRGKAFGLVNFGMSFGGVILPFAALFLTKTAGVQTACAILGSISLLVLVPGVWFLVRDTPEELGMRPDGDTAADADGEKDPAADPLAGEPEPTIRELLQNPLIYRVGFAFTFGILVGAGAVAQLKPRISDLGYDDTTAMAFLCVTALCAACSKYGWGWLADRLSPIRAAKMLFVTGAGAMALAFLPQNIVTVALFAVLSGLAMGSWTLFPAVLADIFGRAHFIAVYRVASVFVFFKSFGYIIMGKSHELSGSYDGAYLVFCALFAIGFFLVPREGTKYRRPPAGENAASAK